MLFNSLQFFLFFPIVTLVYFLLPHKWRWLHLLIASCVFYMAFIPIYILVLFFTIIIDYIAGRVIEGAEGKKRKLLLIMSLVSNIGVLAVFKYYNFFIGNINDLFGGSEALLPLLNIALPIGLSFHTFQAMSYTIEVYRGNYKAERHLGIYALYVMFYPQLVAGPIERPQGLLKQLHEKKYFEYDNVTTGLKLMMWGLFKKVVIADRLALIVDPVYQHPQAHSAVDLLVATFFFAFQIFCDFSGYTDIAIGAARVMGFKLMKNFNRPYHAQSIADFWSRWHISLSTWFRDYVYISLGGNRVSIPRWYFNIMLVFLISGFWHGANWTFIAWGALHGIYYLSGAVIQKTRKAIGREANNKASLLRKGINIFVTFWLVTIAWVFFRANNVNDAFFILKQFPAAVHNVYSWVIGVDGIMIHKEWPAAFIAVAFLELVHVVQAKWNVLTLISRSPVYVRWATYYMLLLALVFFGVWDHRQFIYFQF
ncbi:MAG: MBOAT family protein [Bacteroidetes bacterium]|nr:MBOAT family protein [Bacteroidota bacterium]